jgi:hypothetical protein
LLLKDGFPLLSRLLASKPHRSRCLNWCVRAVDGTKWAEVATSRSQAYPYH